jgi:hypothetical protein
MFRLPLGPTILSFKFLGAGFRRRTPAWPFDKLRARPRPQIGSICPSRHSSSQVNSVEIESAALRGLSRW